MGTCIEKDCNKPSKSKRRCGQHYMAFKRLDPAFRAAGILQTADWKLRNPEKHANQQIRAHAKHKDVRNAYVAQWKKDNKIYYNAYLAANKKRVKRATPKWADLQAIKQMYLNRPADHHVDHILPINGENVSGFHIIENLQYLPILENLKKSNKVG